MRENICKCFFVFFYLGDRNTALDDDAILQVLILIKVFTGASLFPRSHSTWHTQLHLLNLHSLCSSILVAGLCGGHLAQIQTVSSSLFRTHPGWDAAELSGTRLDGGYWASGAREWKLLTLRIEILWITAKENKKQTDVQLQNEGDLAIMFVKCFRGY